MCNSDHEPRAEEAAMAGGIGGRRVLSVISMKSVGLRFTNIYHERRVPDKVDCEQLAFQVSS